MLRSLFARHRPVLALGLAVLAALGLHVVWLRSGGPAGEVVSGFGAALVAIGIAAVGVALFFPGALDRATAGAAPQSFRVFWPKRDPDAGAKRDAVLAETRRGIITERIVVGGVVLVGTLLNGYGPAIARIAHLGE